MTVKSHIEVRRGADAGSIKKDFEDHLVFTLAKNFFDASPINFYQALAYTIRDRLIDRWMKTRKSHARNKVKRVYYLSLEFLMGRLLGNNIINLGIQDEVNAALEELGLDFGKLEDIEEDMGLGNGGLGRLAACFLDSLATLDLPAMGYGIRYTYGIFRQEIRDGRQVEHPDDWLKRGSPWEIPRPHIQYEVFFGGHIETVTSTQNGSEIVHWEPSHCVLGMPYDVPIVGYGGKTVNSLRLWSAHAHEEFDFEDFNKGDYIAAVENKVTAETLAKVLYPNDVHYQGKELRLKQQYFFVSCSLQDILKRFKKTGEPWVRFPDLAAIQLNDTHPSLSVPELMRLLIDIEGLQWDQAWEITVKALAYTNHTLMPEALEKWSLEMMRELLPRHLDIIFRINQKFLDGISANYPGDIDRLAAMSIIQEGYPKQVRMANLAIIGSHATNGVAQIHTRLLKSRVVPEFAGHFPDRFFAMTNGITQRRWLLHANPPLAQLITSTIGDQWITNLEHLRQLTSFADKTEFRQAFRAVKQQAKQVLVDYMAEKWGWNVDPNAIFDVQIKRLHEYKRQLMNAIHIVMLYNRIRENPEIDVHPRIFLFGAKAAPGYDMAKLIIKLINDIARAVNNDETVNQKLGVYFLPNYNVTLAEKMIPAADISEQISTAGTEASGTGNMKFMLNGALTVGTLDGANVEMAEEVGRENMFIFGLDAGQAKALSERYNPRAYYQNNHEVRQALDLIASGHFNPREPQLYLPIRASLLDHGDRYMLMADLPAYAEAHDEALKVYGDQEEWTRRAILNTACSGKFSSDRTISQYAKEIWNAQPCAVEA